MSYIISFPLAHHENACAGHMKMDLEKMDEWTMKQFRNLLKELNYSHGLVICTENYVDILSQIKDWCGKNLYSYQEAYRRQHIKKYQTIANRLQKFSDMIESEVHRIEPE